MNRKVRILLAAILLAAGSAWLWAGSYSSPSGPAEPAGINYGGQSDHTSASNEMDGALGEAVVSTFTSASHILRPGLMASIAQPGTVMDLTVQSPSSATVHLYWSAPGNDGDEGALQPGTRYLIQYSTDPAFPWYAAGAQITLSTNSVNPGSAQSHRLSGLFPNTTYFMTLWTKDIDGNMSAYYSAVSTTTLAIAPLSLATTYLGVFSSSITAAWANLKPTPSSSTAKGYRLEASTANNFTGEVISSMTFSVAQSTLTLINLNADATYFFRVASLNWRMEPNYSVLGSTLTRLATGQPPGNTQLLNIYTSSITVGWNPVSSNGYVLQASTANDFTGALRMSSTTNGSSDQLTVEALTPNTSYFFRAGAVWGGTTAYATNLSTPTRASQPELSMPVLLGVFISSMNVRWSAGTPVNSTGTLYELQGSSTGFDGTGTVFSSRTTSGESAYLINLSPNTTYETRVKAISHAGFQTDATTLSSSATLTSLPNMVATTFLAVHISSVQAQWGAGAPANPAGTQYLLQASSTNFNGTGVTESSYTQAGVSALMENLLPNSTYFFRVRSQNVNASVSTFTVLAATVTRAHEPQDVAFTEVNRSSITVSWSTPAGGAQGFRLEISSTNFNGTGFTHSSVTVQTSALSLKVLSLSAFTTYYARVGSRNHAGHYSYSNSITTATLTFPPTRIQPDYLTVGITSVTARWKDMNLNIEPSSSGAAGFYFEAATSTDFLGEIVSSITYTAARSTLTVGLETMLPPNTTHYFRAGSLNSQGVAQYTVLPATVTLASPPSTVNPQYTQVFASSVTAQWGAGTVVNPTGTSYILEASSTNFTGAPILTLSSRTESLSAQFSTLQANTSYFMRVRSINYLNVSTTHTVLSSTSTLALTPVNAKFQAVYPTSATLNWTAPSLGSRGYLLIASTASDFSGDIVSSVTTVVDITTLTAVNLYPDTTYYFRVGSLNHNGVPNFISIGGTKTVTYPATWVGGQGNGWYTAGNWSPAVVPSAGSLVTINVNNTAVVVSASSPSIRFAQLILGGSTGNRVSLTLSTGVASGGDVTLYGNAGLTVGSTEQIVIHGNFLMVNGSSMAHTVNTTSMSNRIWLSVDGFFDMQAGATITVSSSGYAGGAAGNFAGSGPGGGGALAANHGGGGGGHGGAGGTGGGGSAAGIANDSESNPTDLGSGGGGGTTTGGGSGGGAVIIAASSVTLNGLILAEGRNVVSGARGGGGGAGGTINIRASGEIGGTGSLIAKGGNGFGGTDAGGGGGGGRIALVAGTVCTLNPSTYTVNAGFQGAAGDGSNGSPGTAYTKVYSADPFTGAALSTGSINWTWESAPPASGYQLRASTGGSISQTLARTQLNFVQQNLLPNTTYQNFIRSLACIGSSDTISATTATLARPPQTLNKSFLTVYESSITAAWASLPVSPSSMSAYGYRLEASTASDFTGTVESTETTSVNLSTLTVSNLFADTTYFFRVASINLHRQFNYTDLASTATLARPPTGVEFLEVFQSSATVGWTEPDSGVQGYILEASTAANFTGTLRSSAAFDIALTTLTVFNLDSNATYYFRAGSLNWNRQANYAPVISTQTFEQEIGIIISTHDINLGLIAMNTQVVVATAAVITNIGNGVQTYQIRASTITNGSPWVIGNSQGTNQFVLYGVFNSTQPALSDFLSNDRIADQYAPAGLEEFSMGNQNGVAVPAGDSRNLWFRFDSPLITGTTQQQQIQVSVEVLPP